MADKYFEKRLEPGESRRRRVGGEMVPIPDGLLVIGNDTIFSERDVNRMDLLTLDRESFEYIGLTYVYYVENVFGDVGIHEPGTNHIWWTGQNAGNITARDAVQEYFRIIQREMAALQEAVQDISDDVDEEDMGLDIDEDIPF